MTPKEAKEFCAAFATEIGPRGRVWISISDPRQKEALSYSVYDNWPGGDAKVAGAANTFEEAVDMIKSKWVENITAIEDANVKALALEIISTTDRKGSCSEADLRMSYRFNTDDIARLGARACEAANRMAGRGPFSIQKTSSNGAPAESEAA